MEYFRTEIIPDPDSIKKQPGNELRRFFLDILETVVLSVLLFLGINAISARIRVESISMQPTLYAGDFVIVNKIAYKLGLPSRGDVIIFRYPPDPQREPYIKRVIGLPGDEIDINGGKVYVNDHPINEPYILTSPNYEGKWIVPEDSLFVLGDNRNSSSDSHRWGMVPEENVIGKALLIYWPPYNWKYLDEPVASAAQP